MKKLWFGAAALLVSAGMASASVTVLPSVIFAANYDNNTMDATDANGGVATTITASASGGTWQDNSGLIGGRAGIAGDGGSTITYALPSAFNSSAGMIEFWFNTDNSWAGLTLLDLGNDNKITWNAGSQILAVKTASGNYLSTNLGDYPGGWHHVALTWANSGWRVGTGLYVDGSIRSSNSGDTSGVNASYIRLGNSYNTTNYDELHVYDSGFVDVLYNIYETGGVGLREPGYYYQDSIVPLIVPVPEPATMALLAMGCAGMIVRRKR